MKAFSRALDTNVLVRFLVGDDALQLKKVLGLFDQALESGERFWVSSTVLLELIWVLDCYYQIPRLSILDVLEKVSDLAVLDLEDASLLPVFLLAARKNSMGLSDLLIAIRGNRATGLVTLSFDRKAVKRSGGLMELI
jgi:predicted nucleic-acid-binding protein